MGGRGNAGAGKDDHLPRGTINMIVGGPTDGDSNRARKAHARGEVRPVMEVGAVREPVVSFGAEDQRGVSPSHNDAFVITATIGNFDVARIMVDTGSSVNVFFYEAYLRMGVEMEVKPVETAMFGFGGGVVESIGQVNLSVTIGEQLHRKTHMVSFLVVDSFSTYNVIIGRPALNAFRAVVSTFHMKLKFIMEDGVGEVLGDQQVARKCYVEAVRKGEQKKSKRKGVESERETNPLKMTKKKEKEEPDMMSVKAQEELMSVELVAGDSTKVTRIGTQLGPELATAITSFLRENLDVFARSAEDLGEVDPEQFPREEKVKADHLSKIASSITDCGTRMITVLSDNTCVLGQDVLVLNEWADWRNDIRKYLAQSILLEEKRKASRIQARALGYCLIGGNYEETYNNELMREALNELEEKRERANMRMEVNRILMKSTYDKQVKKRNFQVGDLVLRQADALKKINKLESNWEGPYKVVKVIRGGAYELEDLEGHKVLRPWNVCYLKKFHV
ncbi:hypothetical protein DH2020_000728 [Rehmannia glutinosa]|uniref:Uncharacterized protein n=1 Tax=Rehmannia glutinosa TaxID=99300 RepID=A0ABR0XXF1_REHGL